MQPGDLLDLDVTSVAHGGVFVGRHDGRVVFVPDAIPGERVRVRLTDTRKSSFWRGDVVEVLDASPHRRPHVWRAADVDTAPEDRPGGADFGHIALPHQRELKAEVVRDSLRRFAHVDLPVKIDALDEGDGTGWRTRVSLHVDESGRIGPFAARSHRVISVDELPLAAPALAETALSPRAAAPGRVDFVLPADGSVRVIDRPETAPRRDASGKDRRRGSRPQARPTHADRADGPAFEVIEEQAGGRTFRLDAGGFWQVHRAAADTLYRAVSESVAGAVDPDAWHLDLYGGVGLLAAALAEAGGPSTRVTSVEADARATEHAGDNLAQWLGARAETGRVDRWLRGLEQTASAPQLERLTRGVVVLDPPRVGAGREVVERLADLAPARIVYVACDPVALARDLGTFAERGYTTDAVHAFDLFPHSHHIEAVAVLTR